MFDIGFAELLLIGVIALLVLGPERLPHAARMTGAWIGKIRRSFIDIQAQIEQEVHAEELRKRIQEEMDKSGINELKNEIEQTKQAIPNIQEEVNKNLGLEGFSDGEKAKIENSHRDFAEELVNQHQATETNEQAEANDPSTAQGPSESEISEATSTPPPMAEESIPQETVAEINRAIEQAQQKQQP